MWNKALTEGYVTTDMIDACLMSLRKSRTNNLLQIAEIDKEKDPSATVRRRRDALAKRVLRDTRKHDALLGLFPVSAMYVVSPRGKKDEKCFVAHQIGGSTHMVRVDRKTLEDVAATCDMPVTKMSKLKIAAQLAGEFPSLATVNEIIASMCSYGIERCIDNGAYDPESAGQADMQPEITDEMRANTIRIAKLCVEMVGDEVK
jgi:hypothetical protein